MAQKTTPTEGAEKLHTFLTPGMTAAELARRLKVKDQHVWNWTHGHGRPNRKTRERIEKITGVPASSWLTPEERAGMARELGIEIPATGVEGAA